jgi:hypothetical protein
MSLEELETAEIVTCFYCERQFPANQELDADIPQVCDSCLEEPEWNSSFTS